MEIQGRIKQIGAVQTVGSNGFQKREMVVTTEEQYPQPILIEFTQGNCSLLDNLSVGQQVKVSINIRGREWTNPEGKVVYFNSIQGWRIDLIQTTTISAQNNVNQQVPPPSQKPNTFPTFDPAKSIAQDTDEDDLPF